MKAAHFKLSGKEIKRLRIRADLSQAKLAAQIGGVNQSTVSRWEKNDFSDLSDKTAIVLYRALGLDPPPEIYEKTLFACPNFLCPVSYWERSGGKMRAIPIFKKLPGNNECHCGYCGEKLVCVCSNCQASISPGESYCNCGKPYCADPEEFSNDDEEQHNMKRQMILALKTQIE